MRKLLFLFLLLMFSSSVLFGYTNLATFDSSIWAGGGWPAVGGLDPEDNCNPYDPALYTKGSESLSSDSFLGFGCEKIIYTNKNNFGNYSVVFSTGSQKDFSLYDYLMVYIRGENGSGDNLYCFMEEDNRPIVSDDVWAHGIPSVLSRTNWLQVLIPLEMSSAGFQNVSDSWNSTCVTQYYKISTNAFYRTNVISFTFAVESPIASPANPKSGSFYIDEVFLLKQNELKYGSDPSPAFTEAVKNPYIPVSLEIGSGMSNVRMIVDGIEYMTNDSHLTYNGTTVIFIPTEPFSDVVDIYVDAIDCLTGLPIVATSWWFFIGEDLESDKNLIKNLLISPEYVRIGSMDTAISFFIPSPGSMEIALFSVSGEKLGVLWMQDEVSGEIQLTWDGRLEGKALRPGLYILEFIYSVNHGETQQKRLITIPVLD